jgi:hypothetical protein
MHACVAWGGHSSSAPWLHLTSTQAEKGRELAQIRSEEEEKMATALATRAREKDRQEREVQQLREQSAELRE